MVTLSKNLISVKSQKNILQLRFFHDDYRFGVPWYYHGFGNIRINFDPWSGMELSCKYDFEWIADYEYEINAAKRLYDEYGRDEYIFNGNLAKKGLDDFLDKFGPVDSKKNRRWWDSRIQDLRKEHNSEKVCKDLSNFLKGGNEEGMTSIIHIPNIRTYAILNKKEYGGFEPMDYCPFCGAKLPERLDEKLTEILQKEYGLSSWKDYKKAPHEFHTDEWWKKRGL